MIRVFWIIPCLIILCALQSCSIAYQRLATFGTELTEPSGVAVVNDTIWIHNDGNNPAVLYRYDMNGRSLDSFRHPALKNIDWEALGTDGDGNLYLADTGNNGLERFQLQIYIISPQQGRPQVIQVQFPKTDYRAQQMRSFDVEGMFFYRDSLFMLTKGKTWREGNTTFIFSVSTKAGRQEANFIGQLDVGNWQVTGADFHPGSGKLALTAYRLERFLGIPRLPARLIILDIVDQRWDAPKMIKRYHLPPLGISKPYEGVSFINEHQLLVISESSPINKAFLALIRLKNSKK